MCPQRVSATCVRYVVSTVCLYVCRTRVSQVLMSPSVLSLTVERIVCDGFRTLCGSTMGGAALTDVVPGKQLGKARGS